MSDIQHLQTLYPLQEGATNPLLRSVATPVETIDGEVKKFARALQELLWVYEGVGLAAPQIGQSIRMAAVTQWDMSKRKWKLLEEFVMINPELLGSSDEVLIDEEACLSLPGVTGKVARPEQITVRFQTPDGEQRLYTASGYNARIILHEMDHLDGILFIDKLV